jgi:hypothetical protein
MTIMTPPKGASQLELELQHVREALRELAEECHTLKQRAQSGDVSAVKDASKTVSDIRRWLNTALETEARFDERRKEQDGVVNEYAIDLEHARSTIGCRMARLRRCCGPRGVPE